MGGGFWSPPWAQPAAAGSWCGKGSGEVLFGSAGDGVEFLRNVDKHDHEVLALCQSARPGELPTLESLCSGDDLAAIELPSKGSKQRKM